MKILSRGRDVPLMTPGESLRSRDRDDILFFFARYDYYYRRERSCSSRERTTNVYIFTRASESFIGRARDATFDNDRERRKFREDRGHRQPRQSARVNIISLARSPGRSERVRPVSIREIDLCHLPRAWNISGSISAETMPTGRRSFDL